MDNPDTGNIRHTRHRTILDFVLEHVCTTKTSVIDTTHTVLRM